MLQRRLKGIVLSREQQAAVDRATNGRNVLFVGEAGSGKSIAMLKIISVLTEMGRVVQPCAPTGIAAAEIFGDTIHRWGGVQCGDRSAAYYIRAIKDNPSALSRWTSTDALVIDEISMLSAELLDKLDKIGRALRPQFADKALGGIQVIGSGDMNQLRPVRAKFPFEAECFFESLFPMPSIFLFEQQFRQRGDPALHRVLRDIREGNHSQETERLLNKCVGREVPEDFPFEPINVFPLRDQVTRYNQVMLDTLPDEKHVFVHEFITTNIWEKESVKNKIRDSMIRNNQIADVLVLKKGAQVRFTRNIDDEIKNGTFGTVRNFDDSGFPVVELPSKRRVRVSHQTYSTEDKEYTIKQLPLMLAWAITAHGSQCKTFRAARICFDKTVFDYNMFYLLASRLTSLFGDTEDDVKYGTVGGGLFIPTQIDFSKIRTHPKSISFYAKLRAFQANKRTLQDHNRAQLARMQRSTPSSPTTMSVEERQKKIKEQFEKYVFDSTSEVVFNALSDKHTDRRRVAGARR